MLEDRVKPRLSLVTALLSFFIGWLSLTLRNDIWRFFGLAPVAPILIAIASFGLGIALILLLYLRGGLRIPGLDRLLVAPDEATDPTNAALAERLREAVENHDRQLVALTARLDSATLQAAGITASPDEMLAALKQSLLDSARSTLEDRVLSILSGDASRRKADIVYGTAETRLLKEISILGRRGNLNLVIGVLTTGFAVGLLAYMVLTAKVTFNTWPSLLSHYIPRLSTVVFIEVFSFFFLRLYRNSLQEIRYYQDQLTDLARQRVALSSLEGAADSDSRKNILTITRSPSPPVEMSPKTPLASSATTPKELAELVGKIDGLVGTILKKA